MAEQGRISAMALELVPASNRLNDYLEADDVIDHQHPLIREAVYALRPGTDDVVARARAAFEFVRDEIEHVIDADDARVTWRASDVLRERVGICYAKAHLLAALLRAQGIPAGFCYQKLGALHGLNAVFIHRTWSRLDPRGNRTGAGGQFDLEVEHLAWPIDPAAGDVDYPGIFAAPAPVVLDFLMAAEPGRRWYEKTLPAAL